MNTLTKWGNLILYIAMIVVNAIANILPLGGNTTGEVSAKTPTLFTPAAYTFSIWGVIYILMGLFIIYQIRLPIHSAEFAKVRECVGIWFMVSCLMNIGWIFTWHYHQIGLSLLCMLGLLASLIIINTKFIVGPAISTGERLSIYGFNIYIGWICAATIANAGVFLASVNWTRFGLSEQFWTILVLIIGAAIGISFALNGFRFMATFAIIWAYIGIFVKHVSEKGYGHMYPLIVTVLAFSIILMFTMVVLASIKPEYIASRQF